jgi:hypothetical protein
MRERHLPRVCRSCQAPIARQEEGCWRCGADWVANDGSRTALRVIPGGALSRQHARQPWIPTTGLGNARATTQAQLDVDRWIDEGGSLGAQATTRSPTAAMR